MAVMTRNPLDDEIQTKSISEMNSEYQKDVDLDYRGYIFGKSFELKGVDAHVNRARAWLISQPFDYVRERDKYSPLYYLMGETEPHLEQWKQELMRAFNEQFTGDLEVKYCDIKINGNDRTAVVNMIVQDKLTLSTFPVLSGVSI